MGNGFLFWPRSLTRNFGRGVIRAPNSHFAIVVFPALPIILKRGELNMELISRHLTKRVNDTRALVSNRSKIQFNSPRLPWIFPEWGKSQLWNVTAFRQKWSNLESITFLIEHKRMFHDFGLHKFHPNRGGQLGFHHPFCLLYCGQVMGHLRARYVQRPFDIAS